MKGKAFILCLGLLIVTSTVSKSQQLNTIRKNDIRLSYGTATLPMAAVGFGGMFISIGHAIIHDSILSSTLTSFGSLSFQYQYIFGKVLRFGGMITYQPIVDKYLFKKGEHTQTDSYNIFTLMPRVDFAYLNRGIFSLYSGFAVGLMVSTYNHNYSWQPDISGIDANVAFQLNAIGIRVGKDLGGFIEFGTGFQGLINLGFSAKL